MLKPRHILIIKPSSFGDIVQALPVAAAIKSAWPGVRVSWLVNSQYGRLLENNPAIDGIFLFPRHLWKESRSKMRAFKALRLMGRRLKSAGIDTVIDLQGLLRSGLFSYMSGAKTRIGFSNAREGAPLFYTSRVRVPDPDMHAVSRYLLLASAIGIKVEEVSFPLGVGGAEECWADEFLAKNGIEKGMPLVGLSPSTRWKTKSWSYKSFASLADALAKRGCKIIMIGGFSGEAGETLNLMHAKATAIDGETDPLKMAALLKRLAVLVTVDSGPMHLAAAVGTKVVALFGPTNPRRTGPYGAGHSIVTAPVPCRPCYERQCDRDNQCMREIAVERLEKEVLKINPKLRV